MEQRVKLKSGDYIATDGIYDIDQSKTQKVINSEVTEILVKDISVTVSTKGQIVNTDLSADTYGVLNMVTIPPEAKTTWQFTNFVAVMNGVWSIRIGWGDGTVDGSSTGSTTYPATVRVFYFKH